MPGIGDYPQDVKHMTEEDRKRIELAIPLLPGVEWIDISDDLKLIYGKTNDLSGVGITVKVDIDLPKGCTDPRFRYVDFNSDAPRVQLDYLSPSIP